MMTSFGRNWEGAESEERGGCRYFLGMFKASRATKKRRLVFLWQNKKKTQINTQKHEHDCCRPHCHYFGCTSQ